MVPRSPAGEPPDAYEQPSPNGASSMTKVEGRKVITFSNPTMVAPVPKPRGIIRVTSSASSSSLRPPAPVTENRIVLSAGPKAAPLDTNMLYDAFGNPVRAKGGFAGGKGKWADIEDDDSAWWFVLCALLA